MADGNDPKVVGHYGRFLDYGEEIRGKDMLKRIVLEYDAQQADAAAQAAFMDQARDALLIAIARVLAYS